MTNSMFGPIPWASIDAALSLLPAIPDTPKVRVLLVAIGLQESRFKHRRQLVGDPPRPVGPAKGFWQFERGGGCAGVLQHPSSAEFMRRVCACRGVEARATTLWDALELDDVLAAAAARLLLFTDSRPLPDIGEQAAAWEYYLRNWRPGKPHESTWAACYAHATKEVSEQSHSAIVADSSDVPVLTEPSMPIPAAIIAAPILKAGLDAIFEHAPKLLDIFKGGSEVAQRNQEAVKVLLDIGKKATNAVNEQDMVERLQKEPEAAPALRQAVKEHWFELTDAGGGGIEGAGKRDLAMVAGDLPWYAIFRSPSFWALLLLLPLVYLVVLSLIGVIGSATWSDDVRSALAGTIVGTIVGGAVGYYWGQTTSRNRT